MLQKNDKRFITDILSLGMRAISLTMYIANTIQIAKLQEQVELVGEAFTEFSQNMQIHRVQLAKIHSN